MRPTSSTAQSTRELHVKQIIRTCGVEVGASKSLSFILCREIEGLGLRAAVKQLG